MSGFISTAIPSVEAAVLELLEGAAELDGVFVTDDYSKAVQETKYVWLWKAEAEREFKGIGRRPATQEEAIELTLRVIAVGDTAAEAKNRSYQIAGAVETVLRNDMKLGGTVLKNHVKKLSGEPVTDYEPLFGYAVVLIVAAEARI